MEPYGGPAALGGIITGLMLASWMLGRWQRGLPGSPPAAADTIAPAPGTIAPPLISSSCPAPVPDQRRTEGEGGEWLGALHEDVRAYRLAQQVLVESVLTGKIGACPPASGEGEDGRSVELSEGPDCRLIATAVSSCLCAACTDDRRRIVLALSQPSADPVSFTRV